MKMNGWQVVWSASALPILVACAVPETTVRSVESPTAERAAVAPVEPQADVEAILMGMAELLSRRQRFSVKVRSSYDVVQPSGQKIEFGDIRTLTVSRPDRMRVEAERSDGHKQLVLFDGKVITVFSSPRLVLLGGLVDDADARRGGGGGGFARGGGGGGGAAARSGGFSRSGAAAGGSFSSRTGTASRQAGATQRSAQRSQTQRARTAQAGATQRSAQRSETTWYNQAYSGGGVTYVTVGPPPGY